MPLFPERTGPIDIDLLPKLLFAGMPLRSRLMLRTAAAGLFGGLLLLFLGPSGMLWQGIVCLALGLMSLALWYRGLGSRRPRGARAAQGPTFDANDPEIAALPSTATTHLSEQIRRVRERQKRAGD